MISKACRYGGERLVAKRDHVSMSTTHALVGLIFQFFLQVIAMIVVTWMVPAILFFVSIFGWEHFIGKRDLLPGECMVQFLKDPVFNTSLIVGYCWIPLCILIVLYSFIFQSAWSLSKKAADKEKERQKLLAALAKKPGTSPPITGGKKASNTALGIAAVAMTSSLAPSNTSNQNGAASTSSNKDSGIAAGARPRPSAPLDSVPEDKSEAATKSEVAVASAANRSEESDVPCSCSASVKNADPESRQTSNKSGGEFLVQSLPFF